MKQYVKKHIPRLLIGTAIAIAAAQFVRPSEPLAGRLGGHARDFLADPKGDPEVRRILQRSCADCHSDQARMPWYANVAPVSWMIARHIARGRQKLNLSEWPQNSANERQDIADSVDKDEMPLPAYLWLHGDARLTPREKQLIDRWADSP